MYIYVHRYVYYYTRLIKVMGSVRLLDLWEVGRLSVLLRSKLVNGLHDLRTPEWVRSRSDISHMLQVFTVRMPVTRHTLPVLRSLSSNH